MTVVALRTLSGAWDELLAPDGSARQAAAELVAQLRLLGPSELQARQDLADLDILAMGITFTVRSDDRGIDRAWPFDVVPRIIDADEWETLEAGLVQRLRALNHFIDDIYGHDAALEKVLAKGYPYPW